MHVCTQLGPMNRLLKDISHNKAIPNNIQLLMLVCSLFQMEDDSRPAMLFHRQMWSLAKVYTGCKQIHVQQNLQTVILKISQASFATNLLKLNQFSYELQSKTKTGHPDYEVPARCIFFPKKMKFSISSPSTSLQPAQVLKTVAKDVLWIIAIR